MLTYPKSTMRVRRMPMDVSLCCGVNASTNFGGTAPLKIWEGKKRSKIGVIYDNF